MTSLLSLSALSFITFLPASAEANSRYPYGNQLIVHPRNPDILLERTTFGILISEDHGRTFRWICEPIIGFANNLDPGVGVFEDGSYGVAGPYGLAISHDNACSFPFVEQVGLKDQYVIDISVDQEDPKNAVVVTASQTVLDGGAPTQVRVYQTTDNGRTWTASGPALDQDLIMTTIDVAPSDPQRIYVGGAYIAEDGRHGFVQRSNDRGKTWGPRVKVPNITSAFISGVDPKDPDRVFVRALEGSQKDRLLVSNDGFTTFESVIQFTGSMYGFAISPDGSKIAIGGAGDGVHVASRPATGIAYQFEKRSSTPVNCLKWTPETLYGCGYPNQGPGTFVMGRSDDEGRTWTSLATSLGDIKGTLDRCPNGSPYNNLCIPDWPRQTCLFAKPGALDECAALNKPKEEPVDDGSCVVRPGAAPKAATGFAAVVLAFGLAVRRFRRRR